MIVTAADAEAVIGEAEAIARDAARKEAARDRRRALQAERARRREQEQERKAAEQAERERARRAEEERLRARAEEARAALAARSAELRELAGGSVRDCFEGVEESRDPRGIRHPLPAVLALVVLAMLKGKVALVAVTAWVRNASQDDLEKAGASHRGKDGLLTAPSPKTVTRVLGLAGPQSLSDAVGAYLAAAVPGWASAEQEEQQEEEEEEEEQQQQQDDDDDDDEQLEEEEPPVRPHLRCDGKAVHGARRPDGTSMFILSAATAGVVVADREIPAKTNEIPEIGPMLQDLNLRLPLEGWVITADALHTQRELADLIVTSLPGHYVFTVKKNQPGLHAALRAQCWAGARHLVTEDKGHGRAERRSHLVMDAPEEITALFPHVRQVAKVIRTRTVRRWKGDGKKWRLVTATSTETVYLVTSLSAAEATPAQIAAYIRAHWGIEVIHWTRDATLREDDSKVRATRARNLVTLRNLTTGLITQSGLTSTAATLRDTEYQKDLATIICRLTPTP